MSRTALVTAGAGGVGSAIARRFVQDGYRVAITDVDDARGRQLARDLGVDYHLCDAADYDGMRAVVDAVGDVDVLVNNVGIRGETGAIWEIPIADFSRTLEVNTVSQIFAAQLVVPSMMAKQAGAIVMIASGAARTGTVGRSPYGISKWAVLGVTKSLANELAPWGIRANAVLPGIVRGERFDGSMKLHAEKEGISEAEAFDRIMSRTRLKRLVEPAEIADAVAYLADAAGVTGTFLDVTGGFE